MNTTATKPPTKNATRAASTPSSRALARGFLLLWWAFITYALYSAARYLGSKAAPPLMDWLSSLFDQLRHQSFLIQGLAALVAVAVLVFMVWLTWLAWRVKQSHDIAKAKEAAAERVEHARQGTTQALGEVVVPKLEDIEASVQKLADATVSAARPIPATVAAPYGFSRAASLIGRDTELATLMAGLKAGTARGIYALEGMGGIGKSALAAEVVARLAEEQPPSFPGGAAWIPCDNLRGHEGLAAIWTEVARTLGYSDIANLPDVRERRAALGNALAQRERTLLALDNVEPDLDADALLDTLAITARTAVLLTSRKRIAESRLTAIELPPLPNPAAESVFIQRLRQADHSRPTPEEQPFVLKIAEAVGGLPLALEQVASYAGAQSQPLGVVYDQLQSQGITAVAFKADPKRVLTAVFKRSWDALASTPRLQTLFAGLALLQGASFPREAAIALAKALASGEESTQDAPDPELDVSALVAYALAEALPGGDRLRLHPLLREYAELQLTRLPTDVSGRLGDAMVAHWLAYAQEHEYRTGRDIANMDVLEAEVPGLMGALTWAHEHARHRDVLALAHALNRFLFIRGRVAEARLIRPWALQAAQAVGDLSEERWAAHEQALLNSNLGNIAEARAGYERALALARQLGDLSAERSETHGLAVQDVDQGLLAEARAGYERALGLARQLGDLLGELIEVHSLAVLDFNDGNLHAARIGFERALELSRQLGSPGDEADELLGLAGTIGSLGDETRARKLTVQSLEISERIRDPSRIGNAHLYLAVFDERDGKRQDAVVHYREALRCYEQVQSPDAEQVREALRRLGAEE